MPSFSCRARVREQRFVRVAPSARVGRGRCEVSVNVRLVATPGRFGAIAGSCGSSANDGPWRPDVPSSIRAIPLPIGPTVRPRGWSDGQHEPHRVRPVPHSANVHSRAFRSGGPGLRNLVWALTFQTAARLPSRKRDRVSIVTFWNLSVEWALGSLRSAQVHLPPPIQVPQGLRRGSREGEPAGR
jgi:hypothetical protein